MPKLDMLENNVISIPGTSFTFSAVKPEKLGAAEYTVVVLVGDKSASVYDFKSELLEMEKSVVKACQIIPRSENLVLRVTRFSNGDIEEIHGFKEVNTLNENDYPEYQPGGMTNLCDAVYDAIESARIYGEQLSDMDMSVNIAIYVLTDGQNNDSRKREDDIKKLVKQILNSEKIESVVSVLIGVNTDHDLDSYLENFKNDAGFDSFVGVKDASPKSLAKIGALISHSISSQSQALGTGGPSQVPTSLNF